MAARLTDKQKQKIVADYLESGNYRATGKLNGVSDSTVRRIIGGRGHSAKQETPAENDVLAYMESRRDIVCDILDKGLNILNDEEKLREANPAQITSTIKTLIDKWAETIERGGQQTAVEDLTPLADRLRG